MKNKRILAVLDAIGPEGVPRVLRPPQPAPDPEKITVSLTLKRRSLGKLDKIGQLRGTSFNQTIIELMNDGLRYRKKANEKVR